MSRKQWGHGYYSGLADALVGASVERINKDNIAEISEKTVMVLEDYQKWRENRDPIQLDHVKFIVSSFSGVDFTDCEIRLILNYIWHNEPRGACISGYAGRTLDYKNDYLIVY